MKSIKLIKQAVLVKQLDLSARTIMRMVKMHEFPSPVRIGRLNLWRECDIYNWYEGAKGRVFCTQYSKRQSQAIKKGRPTKEQEMRRRNAGGQSE